MPSRRAPDTGPYPAPEKALTSSGRDTRGCYSAAPVPHRAGYRAASETAGSGRGRRGQPPSWESLVGTGSGDGDGAGGAGDVPASGVEFGLVGEIDTACVAAPQRQVDLGSVLADPDLFDLRNGSRGSFAIGQVGDLVVGVNFRTASSWRLAATSSRASGWRGWLVLSTAVDTITVSNGSVSDADW